MWILEKLFGWIVGGGLASIGQLGLNFYKAKLAADATVEKQTVDLASRSMELDAREADVNGKLLQVEQGNLLTRWVRPAWAAPYVLITWKVLIWDNALHAYTNGNTDPISPWFAGLGMVIAYSYFQGRSQEIVERVRGLRTAISGK